MTRREAIRLGAGAVATAAFAPRLLAERVGAASRSSPSRDSILKRIPSTGEELPVIGMGTWQTFMVERTEAELPL